MARLVADDCSGSFWRLSLSASGCVSSYTRCALSKVPCLALKPVISSANQEGEDRDKTENTKLLPNKSQVASWRATCSKSLRTLRPSTTKLLSVMSPTITNNHDPDTFPISIKDAKNCKEVSTSKVRKESISYQVTRVKHVLF